jgi:hypothetical protein
MDRVLSRPTAEGKIEAAAGTDGAGTRGAVSEAGRLNAAMVWGPDICPVRPIKATPGNLFQGTTRRMDFRRRQTLTGLAGRPEPPQLGQR